MMDNLSPSLVSVVLPAYNAQRYIAASIESVLAQTWRDLELIVIDDGSTDGTARVVQDLAARDPRVRYFWQENRKLGAARNAGIRQAVGELVALIDADDLWLPEKLALQIRALEQQRADLVFTDAILFADDPAIALPKGMFGRDVGRFEGRAMFDRLLRRNSIPVMSMLMRKRWLDGSGGFVEDPRSKGVEDWDLWLRLGLAGAVFLGLAEKLVKYRSHGGQMSRQILPMHAATMLVLNEYIRRGNVPAVEANAIRRDVQSWTVRSLIEHGEYEIARRELRVLDGMPGAPLRRLSDGSKYRVKLYARQWLGWDLHNVFKR